MYLPDVQKLATAGLAFAGITASTSSMLFFLPFSFPKANELSLFTDLLYAPFS